VRPPHPTAPARVAGALILAQATLFAPEAQAQQRPDTELARLRTDYEKGLASASRVIDDIHRLTLRQLERERAEAGDYETAERVKERLDALESAPGAAAIVPPPLVHTLPAARAQTRDGANTEGGREYIDFRKTGGKAFWDLIGLEKGLYEVFLTYSVGLPRFDESSLGGNGNGPGEAPGGTIQFGEVTGLGSGPAAVLVKRVMTTGSWENFIRESIGRHEFKNATATVKVEAASATEGGLLRLRQIELVKVVGAPEAGGATAGSPEPARVLQSLRTRHRKELQEAASAVRARFGGEWVKLEQEFAAAGEAAAAAAVARSRERLFPPASNGKDDGPDVLPGLDPEPEEKKP
jgi:hypothetical protein